MRRGLAALFVTLAGLALLLGYKTSPGGASRPSATPPPTSSTVPSGFGRFPAATAPPPPGFTQPTTPPSTAAPSATVPPTGATAGKQATGTFTGPVVDTRYGPVQVEVTLADGKLTDVRADQLPVDRSRSAALSDRAAPVLRAEALASQGTRVDSVSGASVTSRAYVQSLQAALDAAHA
jgi:uncharacterized protein with FMN-binding domain